ncbi:MAG: DUF1667 domain-containing protein [Tissierellia bacterium]|nr:DUF1667 domain-containing protein [Tissierellia bacterium]
MIVKKKCKVCPVGCNLVIKEDNQAPSNYVVEGYRCNRGKEFGIKEVKEPSRVLTSRVLLENGPMSRLPVKTTGIIPKELVDECMEIIRSTKVSAPVKRGQIIIKDILGTGVDVVAARKVNKL